MPKIKKIRAAALESKAVRHEPLGQTIQADANRGKYATPKYARPKKPLEDDEEGELLDAKTSARIVELSKQQQLELQAESVVVQKKRQQHRPDRRHALDSDEDDDDEDASLLHQDDDEGDDMIQHDEGYVTLTDGAMGLSPEDEALVASMMQNPTQERRTLADIIMEKIEQKERAGLMEDDAGAPDDDEIQLPPKVVEVYTEIGKILSRYRSGKLPKAFKVIPSLSNWEDVLYLTRPDQWTPQAMFQATRIFASNLNPKMAQRFYYLVLLDAVRADIQINKKLNYHYYMALKKSVYKPAAFFKGILLPLCRESCTLREAAIVASVLQRVSIPVHHSAVALHKLATTHDAAYNGVTSIFIKTLLNKKYSLPAPVIGSLVRHFASFGQYDGELPVLWHQAFLVFCQRYKNEIQDEAREALKIVMKKHYHHKITPEIRRELFGAQAYREERKAVDSMQIS